MQALFRPSFANLIFDMLNKIKILEDENMADNILYSKNCTKPIDSTNGTLLVGSGGSGMSYWMVENLKAMTDNNIFVVDPAGELLHDTKVSLEQNGYSVKTLDFRSPETMPEYNPLLSLSMGSEVSDFVDLFFRNISTETDQFWRRAEKTLLTALILETKKKYSTEEKDKYNLVTVYKRLKSLRTNDDLAELFMNVSLHNDFSFYSDTVIKTVKNTLAVHLSFCEDADMAKALSISDPDFADINEHGKTALFVVTSITDITYQWLYNQAISDLLKYIYFDKSAKRTRIIINEAANIGEIHLLPRLINTAQYHNVTFDIAFQSLEQINTVYYNSVSELINSLNLVYFGTSSYFDSVFLGRIKLKEYAKQLNADKCLVVLDGQPSVDDKLFAKSE